MGTKRPRQDSHRKIEQEKTEPADKSMRITIKNDSKPSETKPNAGSTEAELPVPPASKIIKIRDHLKNERIPVRNQLIPQIPAKILRIPPILGLKMKTGDKNWSNALKQRKTSKLRRTKD